MTASYQTNALDVSYNGWTNYQTFNVALWINNDESLYHLALECDDYQDFLDCVGSDATTGDGVKYADPKVNVIELNELIEELKD
jgi:hypothetical protein